MYLSFLILSGTLECPVGNNIGIIVCDLYPIICCICGNQFSGCEWHYCKLKSGSLYLDKELIDLVTRNACPLRFLGSKGLHNAVNYTLYFCSFKGQTASSIAQDVTLPLFWEVVHMGDRIGKDLAA